MRWFFITFFDSQLKITFTFLNHLCTSEELVSLWSSVLIFKFVFFYKVWTTWSTMRNTHIHTYGIKYLFLMSHGFIIIFINTIWFVSLLNDKSQFIFQYLLSTEWGFSSPGNTHTLQNSHLVTSDQCGKLSF